MKKLNHIELFEAFNPEMDTRRVYATCYQGDSSAAVGILNKAQRKKLQDAVSLVNSKLSAPILRLETVDVTGMGYVVHDIDGEFMAMPKSTNPDDYAYYINRDGKMPEDRTVNRQFVNEYDRLFELVEGSLLTYNHHSETELISVDEFIVKELAIGKYPPGFLYPGSL